MATTSSQVRAEIEREIRKDAEVRLRTKQQALRIRDEVRAEVPVDSGEAAASVELEQRRDRKGLPHWWVGSRLWYFHFIEYGTGVDEKGGEKKRYRPRAGVALGPDTPTPEYAPFGKVAHRHGGSTDGISVE